MKNSGSQRYQKTAYRLFRLGFVISIFVGILPLFFRNVDRDQVIIRTFISLILFGVLGMAFTLEHLRARLSELQDSFSVKLSELQDSFRGPIYQSLSAIKSAKDDVFYSLAVAEVVQMEARLRRAGGGELELVHSGMATTGVRLAKNVERSLKATSLWENDPLDTVGKKEYLSSLSEAIKERKVQIKRLFLVQEEVENKPDFIERINQDQKSGVTVRYMHVEDWIGTPGMPRAADFGIWDSKRVWVFTSKDVAYLYQDRAKVEEYDQVFDANWNRASKREELGHPTTI